MTVEIISFIKIGHKEWDRFCAESSGAWFWHTSRWLAYQEARGATNLSFGLQDGDRIVAICPLILEGEAERRFTVEGHPGAWPAFKDWLPRPVLVEAKEAIADHVAQLASLHGIHSATFRSCPLTSMSPCLPGFSSRQAWASRIVDLTQNKKQLHAGLRKSYRALINRGLRELKFTIGPFHVCKELHAGAAGHQTRPDETWQMMWDWEIEGNGIASIALRGNWPVGFVYFILYKNCAYYASGASLEPDVQHALIWHSILRLMEKGIRSLELGWQGQAQDEKGKAIEFFKAGFGGEDVPVVVIERRFTAL